MISVFIDIKADDREEARRTLEEIASLVMGDEFGACCTKEQRGRFGGTVFVTED